MARVVREAARAGLAARALLMRGTGVARREIEEERSAADMMACACDVKSRRRSPIGVSRRSDREPAELERSEPDVGEQS